MTRGDFGFCPRALCGRQPVLPWGESDQLGTCATCVYCPKCHGLFQPDYQRHGKLDGAFFGPNFAPILAMCYPKVVTEGGREKHQPKLFGFKVHASSPMRRKPDSNRVD